MEKLAGAPSDGQPNAKTPHWGALGWLLSDLKQCRLAVLYADDLACVHHLLKQCRRLLNGDSDSLACVSCVQTFTESVQHVCLQTLVCDLCLCRLADTVGFADGLERTLYEEVEVLFCQSFEVDAVDSFCDSHFFHVLTPYLSYIYILAWTFGFVKSFLKKFLNRPILCFSVLL